MAIATGRGVTAAALATIGVVVLTTMARRLVAWQTLMTATVCVILFIPIRRYALPGGLPFQLEAYRVLIAIFAVCWLGLAPDRPPGPDPQDVPRRADAGRVHRRRASIGWNGQRIAALNVTATSVKALTFLASFVIVFYMVASLIRTERQVDDLLRLLVAGGGVVALGGVIQRTTGLNPFNHVDQVLPFLRQTAGDESTVRNGAFRAVSSAQHPIALGAVLALLMPPGLYLARKTAHKRWIGITGLLLLGALASASRTAVTMLIAAVIVFLILRPRQVLRYWPALIPMLAVIHIVMPGLIGGMYKAFFPSQGLVAEQGGAPVGSSRVASLGPGLHVVGLHPLFGVGYGSRVSTGPVQNSFIVDDQWLGTAMETGVIGVAIWVWFFVRFTRKIGGAARRDQGDRGFLFTALTASVVSFAVGMLTFDAFSFIQVTFVLFFLVALGCVTYDLAPRGRLAAAR